MNTLMTAVQMTSKEIATLVESRHDSVKRTIERLAEQVVIELPPTVEISTATKPVQVYVFDHEHKRDSFIVVAQLSPEFTARLVDRWQELEAQLVQPSFAPFTVERAAFELSVAATAAAKAFGFEGNQAILSADKAVRAITGISPLSLMGHTHLLAAKQEPLLTPTDIGKRLGVSPQLVNVLLIECDLQISYRDLHNKLCYELTEEGKHFGEYTDTGKRYTDGTPIRQIKWNASVIDTINTDHE